MRETPADLERLQATLDESIERATPFLRWAWKMPEYSLSAEEVAARLDGMIVVALATVTAKGEPRVAPVDAVFLRGHLYVPTTSQSGRAKNLARNPAVSATFYRGRELAIIIHGHTTTVTAEEEPFDELEGIRLDEGGESMLEWKGDPIFIRIEADLIQTLEVTESFHDDAKES
jgi:hypothetical protein